MTVTLHDHEPAVGEPLPGSPAASPSPEAAETTALPAFVDTDTAEFAAVVAGPPIEDTGATPAPVFVDSSGRRQRRVRRLGLLLAVPAAGYLTLLVSTVLGGPTVSAPFLPLPQAPVAVAPAPTPVQSATDPAPSDIGTERPDSVQPGSAHPATATHSPTGSSASGKPVAPPAPVGLPTSPTAAHPTTAPPPPAGTGTGGATASPSAAPTPGHGRPTDSPGNRPTKL
ncbi:hypothetical protein ACWC9T_33335 [Kitasatospora sp. NPDC001159]